MRLIAILACVVLLSGCARQTIVVATEAAFPPFNDLDAHGDLVGFEIDLIREIAALTGDDIEFLVQPEFARLFDEIDQGRAHVIASTVSVTPERQERYFFTRDYFETGVGVLVRADAFSTLTGLRGRRVGASAGTTSVDAARHWGAADVIECRFSNDAIVALGEGRIDAYLVDLVEARALATSEVVLLDEPAATESYAFLVAHDRPDLRRRLDVALDAVRSDGTIDDLLVKHGLR